MARLTLPMFTPLPEVVSAPLFRVLQNHGSLNRSFCEVTKGTDDSLWLVTTYILSLPPSSVQFHIWKVQQNQECFCRRLFFFLSGEVFFFLFSPNKIIDAGLHRYDKTSWETVQYGTFRFLSCEVLHMQQVLEFKVAALWVANMLPPTLTTYLQQCDWLPSWTCSNVFPQ